MWESSTAASASSAVRTRAPVVPSMAAALLIPGPWAMPMVSSITASAPTMAASSGGLPSRIAGTSHRTTTTSDRPRPSSDRAPWNRPKATNQDGEEDRKDDQGLSPLEVDEGERLRGGVVDRELLRERGVDAGRGVARDADPVPAFELRRQLVTARQRDGGAAILERPLEEGDLDQPAPGAGELLARRLAGDAGHLRGGDGADGSGFSAALVAVALHREQADDRHGRERPEDRRRDSSRPRAEQFSCACCVLRDHRTSPSIAQNAQDAGEPVRPSTIATTFARCAPR